MKKKRNPDDLSEKKEKEPSGKTREWSSEMKKKRNPDDWSEQKEK